MAYGGGTFTVQNKILPGTYINVLSTSRTSTIFGDRGRVGIAINLDWGDDKVFQVDVNDFMNDSLKTFGYTYDAPEMKLIRDLFKNAKKVYFYRLNSGGTKATNTYATAKYAGTRGNDITIKLEANPNVESGFDVSTLIGDILVDKQTVTTASQLVANDFVDWKTFSTPSLTSPIATALSTGTNATMNDSAVTTAHTTFLGLIDKYPVNVVAYVGSSATDAALYEAFVKRVRENLGVKLQVVMANILTTAPDYEGIVYCNVGGSDPIYWIAGALAGCPLNRALTNKLYDGEADITILSTQIALENAIKSGIFTFHQVGDEYKVLEDINSLTTVTTEKNEDFKSNQTIRIIDQVASDIATIFNSKYLGIIPNDEAGRIALWNDIITHHKKLEDLHAIENFQPELVKVKQGDNKKAVVISDVITIVNAMTQLYMTIQIN